MARRLSGDREAVLAAIVAAAENGEVCPTDTQLRRIGAGGSRFPSETLLHFRKRGIITVESYGNARRVTITATGKSTRFDRYSQPIASSPVVDPLPPRVNRDPCPRCGVRGDIGCAHSGRPLGMKFGV